MTVSFSLLLKFKAKQCLVCLFLTSLQIREKLAIEMTSGGDFLSIRTFLFDQCVFSMYIIPC